MGGGSSKNKKADKKEEKSAKAPPPAAEAKKTPAKDTEQPKQAPQGGDPPTPPPAGGGKTAKDPPPPSHGDRSPATSQTPKGVLSPGEASVKSGEDQVRRFSNTTADNADATAVEEYGGSDTNSVQSANSRRSMARDGGGGGLRGRDYARVTESAPYENDGLDRGESEGNSPARRGSDVGKKGRRRSASTAASDATSDAGKKAAAAAAAAGGGDPQTFLLNGENIEFRYPSGSTFVGGFRDGKLHGYGRYCYYPSGDVYEGEWYNDMKHGKGVYTYESGDRYSGEWRQGKKHGIGRYTFASGDEYHGQWTSDRINGRGTFTIVKTGNRYDGEWADSYRHGFGVLHSGNGDIYEGQWVRGKENGLGVLTYASGALYCGEWKHGQMDGKGCVIDDRNAWSLVEHINGYMISNVAVNADSEIEPEYVEVWNFAQAHVKKKRGASGMVSAADSEELEKLRKENAELKKKYQDLVGKMQSSEEAAVQLASDDLRQQLTYYMNQHAIQEAAVEEAKALGELLEKTKAELTQTKDALAKREEEVSELQAEVSALEKEVASRSPNTAAANGASAAEIQKATEKAEKEAKTLQAKVTSLEKQMAKDTDAWKRREETLQKDIDIEKEATKRVELQLQKELDMLKMGGDKKSEALEKHQADLQQKNNNLQRLCDERTSKAEALEKELEAVKAETAAQAAELAAATAKVDELERENNDRDGKAKEMDDKIKKHKKKIKELEGKMKEAETREENLRKAVEASNGKTQTIQSRVEELETLYDTEKRKARRLFNVIEDMKGKIRVYLRARPFSTSEKERGSTSQVLNFPDEYAVKVYDEGNKATREEKEYLFDRCFTDANGQEDVFEDCRHLMQSAVDGFNVCIFAYGQTGSGKTFTLEGSDSMPGVAPRAMTEVFRIIDALGSGWEVKVSCYMVELYNDKLQDLLGSTAAAKEQGKDVNPKPSDDDKGRLDIKKDAKGIVTVVGVTMLDAGNADELLSLYDQGKKNRKTRSTKMNDASSRSHLVFSVLIETTNLDTRATNTGKLSVVDLAGSERLAKTGIKDKIAIQEATSINQSLSALGNVISALSSGEKGAHIPYRDSKLTMLMSDSLGGNAKTLMFVNVSPSNYNTEETVSSLNYATRVKLIKNNPQKAAESAEIKRLKNQIEKLRAGQRVEGDVQEVADGVGTGDIEEPSGKGGDQGSAPAMMKGGGGRKASSPARKVSKPM